VIYILKLTKVAFLRWLVSATNFFLIWFLQLFIFGVCNFLFQIKKLQKPKIESCRNQIGKKLVALTGHRTFWHYIKLQKDITILITTTSTLGIVYSCACR